MSATSYTYLSSLLSLTILIIVVASPAYAATYNVTINQDISVDSVGSNAHVVVTEQSISEDQATSNAAAQRIIEWGLSYSNNGLHNNLPAWEQEGNSTVGYWQVPVETVTVTQIETVTTVVTVVNGTTIVKEVPRAPTELSNSGPDWRGIALVGGLVLLLLGFLAMTGKR